MMKKRHLKIGVVVDQLLPGGVQLAAIEQVKQLNLLGHRTKLLILMRKKYPQDFSYLVKEIPYEYLSDSYPILFRRSIKFPIFSFFSSLHLLSPFLAPQVKGIKDYDILISHGTSTCLTTQALWHAHKIPYLAVIHDPIVFILKKVYSETFLSYFFSLLIPLATYFERSFLADAVATLIDSSVHQNFIQKKYGIRPVILSPGTKVTNSIPKFRGSSILSFGRWQKEKNPQFLLKLAKAFSETPFIIAGNWLRAKDLLDFQAEIRRERLEKQIKIVTGFQESELPKLCAQSRVWVYPHEEAFGLAGLQAAAAGLPIIMPQKSGLAETFTDGVHGFFPKKISLQVYKRPLAKLIKDERLAFRLGKNAWRKVKEEFSWQTHVKKLFKLVNARLKVKSEASISVIEISHAGSTGLSGGDKLFEEMLKRLRENITVNVITSRHGGRHWKKSKLPITLKMLDAYPFDQKGDPVSVFLCYLVRIWQAAKLLLNQKERLTTLYSSTNILPDVLPAFAAKIKNPEIKWIGRVHHLVPPPHKREGLWIVNVVSYLMQSISLYCLRKKADLVIALNSNLYHHLLEIDFPKNRLGVVGAGIDFDRIYRFKPRKCSEFEGIYLGRLHVAKGIYDTIEIWEKVVAELKTAKLGIIGAGPQIIRQDIRKEIRKRNLADNIKILGYLSDQRVYDHLKSAKIFLFTDHEAGWGMAVAEAMACGLPVVAYDIDIFGDVYKQGYQTVKLGDKNAFAEKVIQILKDKKDLAILRKDAFTQAKSLDWNNSNKKFLRLFWQLQPSDRLFGQK